jgi:thiol-disulfide isomerase/thioredoxin
MNLRTSTFAIACVFTLLLQACSKSGPAAPSANTVTAQADAVLAAAKPADTDAALAAGRAPTFQDLNGKPVKLTDYAGKKVFVNFWASWCAPCIKEIPSISRAATALANENFVFLLASDESIDTIKNFLLDRGFTGNFVKMDGFVGSVGVDVMPTSVLYDEHGGIVRSWQGASVWDSEEMLAQIRAQ